MKFEGEVVRKGKAEGKALVTEEPISFLGGINPNSGKVIEKNHELENNSIEEKILVFPHGKGSTVGSYVLHQLSLNNKAPRGIITRNAEPIVAVGAIIAEIPMVHKLNKDPIRNIEDGDIVRIDENSVEVKKNETSSRKT